MPPGAFPQGGSALPGCPSSPHIREGFTGTPHPPPAVPVWERGWGPPRASQRGESSAPRCGWRRPLLLPGSFSLLFLLPLSRPLTHSRILIHTRHIHSHIHTHTHKKTIMAAPGSPKGNSAARGPMGGVVFPDPSGASGSMGTGEKFGLQGRWFLEPPRDATWGL